MTQVAEQFKGQSAVVGVFATQELADQAVKELQKSGFDMKKLSVIGKGYHTEEQPQGFYTTGEKMKVWGGIGATWGAIWGGFWGLLAGAAFLAVPGVGPVMAAGPLVSLLVGALEGGIVVGGLSAVGAALFSLGVPKDSVIRYEQSLKADKYLLIVHGTPAEVAQAKQLMDEHQATEASIYSA
ncbi:MAG: permease [Firmicutes bacterium]|nr:permease [Bacillota bacterium]